MTVEELIRLLEAYPRHAEVTVSDAPGTKVPISGHTTILEHDGGELCQPCEVSLLAGKAWEDADLDGAYRAA